LWKNGQLIMGGLISGIESEVPSLRRSLRAITTDVGGSDLIAGSRFHVGQRESQYGYGNRVNQNNYRMIINEAPRHLSETLSSCSIARSPA
jgi:hypothetical protein